MKLRVELEGKTLDDISNFMKERAFSRVDDILSRLFEYGITEREGIDVESRRSEMLTLGSKYAAMRLEASELYGDNRAITMALSLRLEENRRLRKLAEARGLIRPGREPWDDWKKDEVDRFSKRYLLLRGAEAEREH